MTKASRYNASRRAFVLLAVLVIVGCALLVATGVVFLAQADVAGSAGAADAAQSRALAWSGLQAVMSRLNDQRDRILNSELPQLDEQYVIYETDDRLGVVRLLPMAAGTFAPEAGKLDLNSVTAEMLANTGLIDQAAAAEITAYRDAGQSKRQFQSIAELLRVPAAAITPEMIFGPIESISITDDAHRISSSPAERSAGRLDDQPLRGLADVLTVFSIEPVLQRDGSLRINLNQPWSEALAERIERQFGTEAVSVLKGMMESGMRFENDAAIIRALRALRISPEQWPNIIDALTTTADQYRLGRLDINTAPLEALQALPGVSVEQAAQMASTRDELPQEQRQTIAWPVTTRILPEETLENLADLITTRCWIYRVRIAAGEVAADEPEGPMRRPVVIEAVIDLSSPKPRVAYLRDVTSLQHAARIALSTASAEPAALSDTLFAEPFGVSESVRSDQNDTVPGTGIGIGIADDAALLNSSANTQPRESDAATRPLAAPGDPEDAAAMQQPGGRSPATPPRRPVGRWRPVR